MWVLFYVSSLAVLQMTKNPCCQKPNLDAAIYQGTVLFIGLLDTILDTYINY